MNIQHKIEKFENLMQDYIGPNRKIIGSKFSNLTAPGENYFSLMIQVDLKLKNQETGKEEDFHAVAKCLSMENAPPGPEDLHTLNFKNELIFYQEIIPLLKSFQRDNDVPVADIFPEFYAGRYNLHGKNSEIDKNTIIILENLKSKGYSNGDRHVGFSLEEAKFILTTLAEFHAVPFALKLKKPYVFEEKIKNNIGKPSIPLGESLSDASGKSMPGPFQELQTWFQVLADRKECQPYLEVLKKKIEAGKLRPFKKPVKEGLFDSLGHQDFWVNNTMQRYENGRIVQSKILDLQMFCYDSVVNDLIFFLFSSVKIPVLRNYLDELIRHYHSHFIKVLENFKCNGDQFNYYKFLVEIDARASHEFFHLMFMSIIIFGKKNEFVAMKGLKEETITEKSKEMFAYVVEEFGKRGWLP